jgi:lysophospholipid acyltransferase (LPLAT)-like uncharacterized protein
VSGARYPWWVEPAAAAGALCVRALGATWRIQTAADPEYVAAFERGERFIYAFWHARLLPLVYVRRDEGAAVLVSRHRDGQLITRVIEHMGFTTARGSSTRGGEAGVRELLAAAASGLELGITPDGPRGPSEVVKEGLLYVAARSGLRIVPLANSARASWVLRSWDRFRIPKPFARLHVCYGAPIAVSEPDEKARLRVEAALREVTKAASRASGELP